MLSASIAPDYGISNKVDILRCQVNRLLYVVSLQDTTPQVPKSGEVDAALVLHAWECAVFARTDPTVQGLKVLASWRDLERFYKQPTVLMLYDVLESLIGIFHLSANQNGVINDCPYALTVSGVSLKAPTRANILKEHRGVVIGTRLALAAAVAGGIAFVLRRR
jgi:hypothetical protein